MNLQLRNKTGDLMGLRTAFSIHHQLEKRLPIRKGGGKVFKTDRQIYAMSVLQKKS